MVSELQSICGLKKKKKSVTLIYASVKPTILTQTALSFRQTDPDKKKVSSFSSARVFILLKHWRAPGVTADQKKTVAEHLASVFPHRKKKKLRLGFSSHKGRSFMSPLQHWSSVDAILQGALLGRPHKGPERKRTSSSWKFSFHTIIHGIIYVSLICDRGWKIVVSWIVLLAGLDS